MSRVTRAEWYRRVNATWPAVVPQLTAEEAVRAGRRLYRLGMKRTWRGPVRVTSGNRYTWISRGEMLVNPEHGWHGLVHLLSHYCFERLHSTVDHQPHGAAHARFEMRMIKAVINRGWLDGKLKSEPKPAPIAPTASEKIESERCRLLAAQKRWSTKAKRAATALKKIERRLRHLQRRESKLEIIA